MCTYMTKYIYRNDLIILQTVTDVFPTTESTGADSNEDSDMFPSQAGLGIELLFTSVGINCTSNPVASINSSCKEIVFVKA